jgi:2-polyprenyl-3-methyl-5-hydroxy-6-metoxy-1,4-benzoquinol methylase
MANPGASWYENEDAETRLRMLLAAVRSPRELLREPHQRFLRTKPATRLSLLDVGCAEGGFLAIARRWYDVVGLDFNRRAIAIARDRFGLDKVYPAAVEDIPRLADDLGIPRQFDVVTLFDVIEHVEQPLALLKSIHEVVKSGGRLVINTPNRTRRPNFHEPFDFPPHHISWWSPEAMRNILRNSGFIAEEVTTYTGWGYLPLTATDALPLLQRVKAKLAVGAPADAATHTSDRARRALMLARMRRAFNLAADLPVQAVLRLTRAPGQMLYAVGRKDDVRSRA